MGSKWDTAVYCRRTEAAALTTHYTVRGWDQHIVGATYDGMKGRPGINGTATLFAMTVTALGRGVCRIFHFVIHLIRINVTWRAQFSFNLCRRIQICNLLRVAYVGLSEMELRRNFCWMNKNWSLIHSCWQGINMPFKWDNEFCSTSSECSSDMHNDEFIRDNKSILMMSILHWHEVLRQGHELNLNS